MRYGGKNKIVVAGIVLILIVIGSTYIYFNESHLDRITVSELKNKGSSKKGSVRVEGKVKKGTINFDNENSILTFDIFDEVGRPDNFIHVVYKGIKLNYFAEGKVVWLEGMYDRNINTLTSEKLFIRLQVNDYDGKSWLSYKLRSLKIAIENNQGPGNDTEYLEALEKDYLDAFPATFDMFKLMFYGNDHQTIHSDHLALLQRLSDKYPERVLSIWMGVATNGRREADAIEILQHQFAKYGAGHTKEFAKHLLSKPKNQRLSIIHFIVDTEDHDVYLAYQTIMKNLRALNYNELFMDFDIAKKNGKH